MNFMRFKGPVVHSESLTPGKIYLGRAAMESTDVIALDLFIVPDDDGHSIHVTDKDERFEFLSSVYAVVVKAFDGYRVGEVTILNDVTADGQYAEVADYEDCQLLSSFVILDSTNVYPGIMVMNRFTGVWRKVVKVDESQWLGIEEAREGVTSSLVPPTDFAFAVSDGEVLTKPMVRCLVGGDGLTEGGWYCLDKTGENTVRVANDSGEIVEYLAERFKM